MSQLINPALIKGYSNPNLLINAEGEIDQRIGGSYTADGYTFDRWILNQGGQTSAFSRMVGILPSGWNNVRPFAFAAASVIGSNRNMEQRIENALRFKGKTVTFSCLVQGVAGQEIQAQVQVRDSIYTDVLSTSPVTIGVCTGGIDYFTYTFEIPEFDEQGFDFTSTNNHHLSLFIFPQQTHLNVTYIGSPKLEFGDTATETTQMGEGETLQRCKRFYQRIRFESNINTVYLLSAPSITFPVKLRETPTVTLTNVNNELPGYFTQYDQGSSIIANRVMTVTYLGATFVSFGGGGNLTIDGYLIGFVHLDAEL